MGVDCTFFPLDYGDTEKGIVSFSRLSLERRRELWPEIAKFENTPVKKLTGFVRDTYGDSDSNPYGNEHKAATVKDLLTIREHEAVQDNEQNRAVWSYLSALNPETLIVIYWH